MTGKLQKKLVVFLFGLLICAALPLSARAAEEEKVKKIVEEWILEIIYGLTTLIHIFNPTCVVLGGGIMGQTYVIKRIQELLYDNIMPSFHEVMIKQAELGNTAGLLGAAQCALEIGDEK